MEPQWTKQISSELVCNFFYVFFVVYAVIAVISLIGVIGIFTFLKVPKAQVGAIGIQGLIGLALATTQMLFLYLICDRALKPSAEAEKKEGFYAAQQATRK
jgi:uncharacterized membrane protein